MLDKLSQKGVRLSLDAETLLMSSDGRDAAVEKLLLLDKPFFSKEDVEKALLDAKRVEIIRPRAFRAEAREHSADVQVIHSRDVTGKSRTRGDVGNFVNYFRNRYERLSRMLKQKSSNATHCDLADLKRQLNQKVRMIVLVSDKRETKKGNLLLEVEDLTGTFKVVVSKSGRDEKAAEQAKGIMLDDVVAITGKVLEAFMIAEDIEWPETPILREPKLTEEDLAIAYLSDLHFGSRYFLEKHLDSFSDWLHGRGKATELAGKVKYILIAGDVVDGIGIYPRQENELIVKDIYSQYGMFDDFIEGLPDDVEVIVSPGNHDAVRRGEPMPAISEELIKSNVVRVGSPSMVKLHGIKHLVYHGTSIDSMIANLPNASYMHPEKVMMEYLKRRHLSPLYGGNLIIPEDLDYLVIDDVPDILHCGHVHKNGYTKYRGTLIINSGTFQDRTDFQVKQGHVPTPALVPVYETKYGRLKTLDFKSN
ncbi:MAG: DNA-directed DNA polymerase II small subunit [Candidatus Micrarchaeota archaeon]